MKYGFSFLLVVYLTGFQSAFAEDLFPDGSAREMAPFAALSSGTTIGGYALFEGGRVWKLVSSNVSFNNMNIRIGSAVMVSPIGTNDFAAMQVVTSMGGGWEGDGYFSADVCNAGTAHLFMVNRGAKTHDNCLIIDPYVATSHDKSITSLAIRIRNSQSSWRLYDVSMLLNLSLMGFPNTVASDWSEIGVSTDPKKKKFLTKVFVWAKQLQDAVNIAIGFSKPKDAFVNVPPINTLLVVD